MKLAPCLPLHLALVALASTACVAGSLPVGTVDDATDTETSSTPPSSSNEDATDTETSGQTSTPPSSSNGDGSGEEPTGGDVDAECNMTDPSIDATAEVDIGDWPVADPFDIDLAANCTVDAVVQDDATVETTMTCDDAGIERPLVVTTAAPTAPVAWGPGEIVEMSYSDHDYDEGVFNAALSLHRADDGALLVAAYAGSEGDTNVFDPMLVAPLTVTLDFGYCGGEVGNVQPILMTFANGEGDSLALVGGHSGRLPAGGGNDEVRIYVPEALTGWEGESAHSFRFLLQRQRTR